MKTDSSTPYVVACIPAYKEEKNIGRVVLLTKKYVDGVVVCDDGSGDLTSEIAETTCFYVLIWMISYGGGYVW